MSFRLQPENGFLVKPFYHMDSSDCELQDVQRVLEKLLEEEDVREVLQATFHLRERICAKFIQASNKDAQALQAVRVTGAAMAKVNGRYVLRPGPLKCGRPTYIHEESQRIRILWSE